TNLTNYWQTVDRKQTMQTMFLIVGERRILPSEINIGQGGARAFEMVFPRSVDGHPVLDPTTKSFGIEFEGPVVENSPVVPNGTATIPVHRVFFEFKPGKMMFQGHLDY